MIHTIKKTTACVTALALLSTVISCSTSRAHLDYSEFASKMPVQAGSYGGQNLGKVTGEEGGAVWDDCSKKAKGSLMDMIANARAKGATAVGDVKWYATGTSEPSCKKGWGYVIVWPFLLTPLFMSTRVDGIAYKGGGKKSGMYQLPTDPQQDASLADRILAMGR